MQRQKKKDLDLLILFRHTYKADKIVSRRKYVGGGVTGSHYTTVSLVQTIQRYSLYDGLLVDKGVYERGREGVCKKYI